LVAPVSRLKIMLGRTLGGATVAVIQGLIVLLLSIIVGFRPTSISMIPLALLYMVLIAVTFTALGTAIASFIEDMQGFQIIINFLIMPLFFLSGALFPLESLPKAVVIISMINPLAYGVDGLRGTLINMAHFGLVTDFCVLGSIAALVMLAGAYLFSKIEV
jgi:ABC-2 type transport system permease protein